MIYRELSDYEKFKADLKLAFLLGIDVVYQGYNQKPVGSPKYPFVLLYKDNNLIFFKDIFNRLQWVPYEDAGLVYSYCNDNKIGSIFEPEFDKWRYSINFEISDSLHDSSLEALCAGVQEKSVKEALQKYNNFVNEYLENPKNNKAYIMNLENGVNVNDTEKNNKSV